MPIGGMGSEEKWRLGDRLHREPRGRYGTWNLGHLVLGTTNAGQLVRRPTRTPTTSGGSQSINLVHAVAAVFSQNSHLDGN